MNESLENAMQHWNMVAPAIDCPKNKQDYETLLTNIQDAIELVENREKNPLIGLIEAMANAAQKYEKNKLKALNGGAIVALKYLIKLHGIRQSELKEIGSQGVVSELLSRKRELTLRHVRELAKKFNVSPNVFVEE